MAEKRLQGVSVWTDVVSNSGTQESMFVAPLAAKSVVGLDGTERLTLTVDTTEAAWSDVDIGKVLRTEFTNSDWDEWRVVSYETQRAGDGVTAEIIAQGIRYDLRYRAGLAERVEANGFADLDFTLLGLTPSKWVDELLLFPDMPSYFAKGTVNPTTEQSISVGPEAPLDLLMELEFLANRSDGGAELDIRRNGTTDYKIDLVTARGSTAEKAFLHGLKNLQRVKHRTTAVRGTDDGQITRAYPVGGGDEGFRITMGRNLWTVSATASTTIDLAADNLGDPIRYDDQLNNLYVVRPDGVKKQITDSTVTNQRLTLGASHGVVANDEIRIARNSAGDELTYLEHPTSLATYGQFSGVVERADFPNVNQLLGEDQAFLGGTYVSGVAPGWNAIGSPTLTEETSSQFVKHGTSSQKVVAADTEGIITDAITVAPGTDDPFLTAQIHILVTSLAASTSVRFQLEDVTNTVEYPSDASSAGATTELNKWIRLDIQPGVNFNAAATTSVKLKVWATGGAATFYVDAGQLSDRATPPNEFVNGRVSNALWHSANDALDEFNAPIDTLDVGVIDVDRVSDTDFVFSELVLGGTVIIVDEDLGLDLETRIVELRQNLLEPGDTQIALSKKPEDLAGLLGKRTRRPVPDLSPPAGNSFLVAVPDDLDEIADGTTYKRVANVNASNEVTNTSVADDNVELQRLKFRHPAAGAWAVAGSWFNPGLQVAGSPDTSARVVADGELHVGPFTPVANDTLVDLALNVSVSGNGNARIVVYEDDDTFYPGAKLFESSSLSLLSTGLKTAASANVTVVAGQVYWIGWIVDLTSGTPQLTVLSNANAGVIPVFGRSAALSGTYNVAALKTGESFPAADPFPAGATANPAFPGIGCKL
jgi:hypothetical protein